MKKYLLITFLFFIIACGNTNSTYQNYEEPNNSITTMTMLVPENEQLVTEPIQLSVSITLNNGERIKVTDRFVNPYTGKEFKVTWQSSNREIAIITENGRLIPVSDGYVTAIAIVEDVRKEKVIHVKGPNNLNETNQVAVDIVEQDFENENLGEEEHEEGSFCRTHAIGVMSFSPGENSGFGGTEMPDIVLGPPNGNGEDLGSFDVVSLGENGEIVLDLGECYVTNGIGPDLIVFENSFFTVTGDIFYELGIVGVSNDGESFVEFDCDEDFFLFSSCAGVNPVYASEDNDIDPFNFFEAGGDYFDLEDIGVESARYVRIRDINNAYIDMPGPSNNKGFDLDAISVINGQIF